MGTKMAPALRQPMQPIARSGPFVRCNATRSPGSTPAVRIFRAMLSVRRSNSAYVDDCWLNAIATFAGFLNVECLKAAMTDIMDEYERRESVWEVLNRFNDRVGTQADTY